jgi:hypothetical protein
MTGEVDKTLVQILLHCNLGREPRNRIEQQSISDSVDRSQNRHGKAERRGSTVASGRLLAEIQERLRAGEHYFDF